VMDFCFQLPESPVAIYLTSYGETTNKKLGWCWATKSKHILLPRLSTFLLIVYKRMLVINKKKLTSICFRLPGIFAQVVPSQLLLVTPCRNQIWSFLFTPQHPKFPQLTYLSSPGTCCHTTPHGWESVMPFLQYIWSFLLTP
jgi:hypothetical protein